MLQDITALDRIQQQGADLLSLDDEHLPVDSNGLPLRGLRKRGVARVQ